MSNAALQDEYATLCALPDADILEYFLFRSCETDEVWGLKDKHDAQWLQRETAGLTTLPIWPSREFAAFAAAEHWPGQTAAAESLEYFLHGMLDRLARQQLVLEILPRPDAPGCLIKPQRLFDLLDNLRESSECSLGD